jgi:hypothetical protein
MSDKIYDSEDKLTADCYTWFHNTYPELRGLLFHVPNGGTRDIREATKFKAMGLFPGEADQFFFYKGKLHLIEFKLLKGKQSPSQVYIEHIFTEHGASYDIIRTFESYEALITNIINS